MTRRNELPAAGFLALGAALAFAVWVQGAQAQGWSAEAGPTVDVTGGKVRGARSEYDRAVYVFKGIPYGADTGGANRFHPPRPVTPWSGVRDATKIGNRCPGRDFAPSQVMPEEALDLDSGPTSEDCLFLNVWTPALDGGKRPVMVWFHGGGFNSGSGGSVRYDGTRLAARQDVVLVTTNHRLNVFGYLNLAGLGNAEYADAANVGVLDMVQSLEWVRANIAKFGGDPNNVTIFGQSAGGSKVTTLMATPAAKSLFSKVIAQSGFASAPAAFVPSPRETLNRLCVGNDLKALATLSTAAFTQVMGYWWWPWADGKVIPAASLAGAGTPVSADVPMMMGWTQTESTFSGPIDPLDDAALKERVAEIRGGEEAATREIAAYRSVYPGAPNNLLLLSMMSDDQVGRDAIDAARQKASLRAASAYVYHFRGMTEVRNLMSPHTLEIAYHFDNLGLSTRTNGQVTPEKQKLADTMSAAWANFARSGVPSAPGLPEWKPYTAEGAAIMVLGPQPQLIAGSEGLLKILGQPASPAGPRGNANSSGRYRWWYQWARDYLAAVARWARCSL
jgi:para-nitrobenzyl esterase